MLRITLHRDGAQCCLELAGRLCGPWVGETENAWRAAQSSAREIEVDIREVTGLDDAGRELLKTIHRAGARLTTRGLWMKTLVDEITGDRPVEGTKQPARHNSGSRNSKLPNQEK